MSDETEYVEVAGKTEENAVLLLDAAQSLDYDHRVVRTTSDGFVVPKDVADKAKLGKPAKASTRKPAPSKE